jgi:hypothetical protein
LVGLSRQGPALFQPVEPGGPVPSLMPLTLGCWISATVAPLGSVTIPGYWPASICAFWRRGRCEKLVARIDSDPVEQPARTSASVATLAIVGVWLL